jgi:GT2 family glycosyltransferase
VFEAVGGFDERIRVLEDWELQERVKRRGWPLYFRADLPVIHRDRGTPAASWRHSWYWGTTYRETFLKVAQPHWPWLHRPGLFWLNLPRLFQHRVRLVVRQAWAVSRRDTLICFPFLLATILAWALSVCVARRPAVRPEDAGG